MWPVQIAEALRGLIHEANQARAHGARRDRRRIAATVLLDRFRHGVLVGLSDTLGRGDRPGESKARTLLEVLRDRPADVLRFVRDLTVPPTSNQAERDLRPSKVQQNTSGRLTSEDRARDRDQSTQRMRSRNASSAASRTHIRLRVPQFGGRHRQNTEEEYRVIRCEGSSDRSARNVSRSAPQTSDERGWASRRLIR